MTLPMLSLLTVLALGAGDINLSPGSAERAALLDMIRPAVEAAYDEPKLIQLEKTDAEPVIFRVKSLEQEAGWVLAWLEPASKKTGEPLGPQRRDGGKRLTGYVYALLQRGDAGWKLVATSIYGDDWPEFEKTVERHTKGLLHPHPGSKRVEHDVPPWLRSLPPLPARCIPLAQAAEVFDAPRGVRRGTLPAQTNLRLGAFDGAWVQVAYTPGANPTQCGEARQLEKRNWVQLSSLPAPAVIAQDFVPLNADAKPLFTLQWLESEEPEVEFRAPKPMLQASLLGYRHQTLHVSTMYTGVPAYPLALLYTGFNSEMFGDASALALFGAGKVATWKPEQGNRVTPELVSAKSGELEIREAFHCNTTMLTTLTISEKGVERKRADVSISLEHAERGRVRSSITVYTATDRAHSFRLAPGDRVVQITGYDLATKLVQVSGERTKLNHKSFEGWVELNSLDNLEVPFGTVACCGCG